MDLAVDTQIMLERTPKPGFVLTIDPYNQEDIDKMFLSPTNLPHDIAPGSRALLCTEETITMPPGMVGLTEVRSSWARLGFISPPTVIDPGFHGQITFELFNSSQYFITIRPGDKIWSVTYSPSSEPLYHGRYQGQKGIQIPKALVRS